MPTIIRARRGSIILRLEITIIIATLISSISMYRSILFSFVQAFHVTTCATHGIDIVKPVNISHVGVAPVDAKWKLVVACRLFTLLTCAEVLLVIKNEFCGGK